MRGARSDAGTWNPRGKVEITQRGSMGRLGPMHWWGSGMNALQNWRTEVENSAGAIAHHVRRASSNVAAIGTDSNRARRCKPRSIHANIETTRSIFERCAAFVRERAQYSS